MDVKPLRAVIAVADERSFVRGSTRLRLVPSPAARATCHGNQSDLAHGHRIVQTREESASRRSNRSALGTAGIRVCHEFSANEAGTMSDVRWGLLMEIVDRSRVADPPALVGPADWH